MHICCYIFFFFFFNDTATTEIYTLSLHDALPIWLQAQVKRGAGYGHSIREPILAAMTKALEPDRKSTRLNSSHMSISYAVFCLKKKKGRLGAVPDGATHGLVSEQRTDVLVRGDAAEQDDAVVGSNFFFNDTATTEIYTLSLHDALPI